MHIFKSFFIQSREGEHPIRLAMLAIGLLFIEGCHGLRLARIDTGCFILEMNRGPNRKLRELAAQ